eukprot:TRINITY_DN16917_c0_g1_i1.p1 TRINITY_DN16917_c0_g1~~TRINITY_DN16917_c0_g1_i1.p1  ORF type:complete len:337 (+),score=100.06 TRINITY_DN16917_c0_g1_i1:44-1054(+)
MSVTVSKWSLLCDEAVEAAKERSLDSGIVNAVVRLPEKEQVQAVKEASIKDSVEPLDEKVVMWLAYVKKTFPRDWHGKGQKFVEKVAGASVCANCHAMRTLCRTYKGKKIYDLPSLYADILKREQAHGPQFGRPNYVPIPNPTLLLPYPVQRALCDIRYQHMEIEYVQQLITFPTNIQLQIVKNLKSPSTSEIRDSINAAHQQHSSVCTPQLPTEVIRGLAENIGTEQLPRLASLSESTFTSLCGLDPSLIREGFKKLASHTNSVRNPNKVLLSLITKSKPQSAPPLRGKKRQSLEEKSRELLSHYPSDQAQLIKELANSKHADTANPVVALCCLR